MFSARTEIPSFLNRGKRYVEKKFHVYQQGAQQERDHGDDFRGDFFDIAGLHNLE